MGDRRVIVDLFCGGGGWLAAIQSLGLPEYGYEIDPDACATYKAAGGHVLRCDLIEYRQYRDCDGLVGSPPCQPYSKAGKQQGRNGKGGMLPLVCARWALVTQPKWVALEQVPGAASMFTRVAAMLSAHYHVTMYELHAEQYGVPQTRDRVILMAHKDAKPPRPEPTHSRYHRHNPEKLDPGVPKWVSMAQALQWGMTERPGMAVTAGGTTSGGVEVFGNGSRQIMGREIEGGRWVGFPRRADDRGDAIEIDGVDYRERDLRDIEHPSLAVTSKARSWRYMGDVHNSHGAIRAVEHPSATVTASQDNSNFKWMHERPSPTIVSEYRPDIVAKPNYRTTTSRQYERDSVSVTYNEAAILQSFPPDWPWRGSRTSCFRQVGNAIPPLLARAVVSTLENM